MAGSLSPDERPVTTVYPSVASLAAGRALGALYESVPLPIGRVKLSHLLFPLPTSPVALVLYFLLKATGPRYLLTTHRLRVVRGLSAKAGPEVPLDEVGRIEVVSSFGQRFYKAGDLVVHDHVGTQRLRLRGVVRPEMFRQTILDARDALIRTEAARRTIEARHAPGAGAA
ncbi:MAG TPA: PH domain-containing protein [Planctomycetaceae bacterium]